MVIVSNIVSAKVIILVNIVSAKNLFSKYWRLILMFMFVAALPGSSGHGDGGRDPGGPRLPSPHQDPWCVRAYRRRPGSVLLRQQHGGALPPARRPRDVRTFTALLGCLRELCAGQMDLLQPVTHPSIHPSTLQRNCAPSLSQPTQYPRTIKCQF